MRKSQKYLAASIGTLAALASALVIWGTREPRYFPARTFDQFEADWYSKHLRAAGESPLRASGAVEVYRFTWLRTFDHPVVVRAELGESGAALVATELTGQGGYDPGAVARSRTVQLSEGQWESLLSALDRAGFWELGADDNRGCDGAEWVLEGVRHGQYQAVGRWSPEAGPFRDACLRMLELAGVDAHPIY